MSEELTPNEFRALVIYHCKILSDRIAQPLIKTVDAEFFVIEAQRILTYCKMHKDRFEEEKK